MTIKDFFKRILYKYVKNFLFFYKYLGYRLFIRMFLSITVGVLDGFGLAMFLPLFQMIDGKGNVQAEHMGNLSFLVEGLHRLGITLNLQSVLLVLGTFFLLKGCVYYINQVFQSNLRELFIRKVRIKLTTGLSRLSYQYFVTSDVGRIQNTTTGEVDKLSEAYAIYFEVVQHIVLICVYLGFTFYIDVRFASLIMAGGILTNFLFTRFFRSTTAISKKVTDESHGYQGLIIQFSNNFKYIKATASYRKIGGLINSAIKTIENDYRAIGRVHAFIGAAREPVLVLVLCTVIYLHVFWLNGTLGAIILSLLFFYRALSSLVQMQGFYNNFLKLSGTLDNIVVFEKELKDNEEQEQGTEIAEFKNNIQLSDISFGYSDRQIINGISLTIPKNETIAFVGESGSGKTTLINLITGLLNVDRGRILIDGNDLTQINKASYRQRIGYISQEPAIFSDSIFNNITLWDQPTEENKAKFWNAVRQAALEDFIVDQDEKEQTLLGHSGVNISGGQKQRIAIARELYKDIDILVLDEATSALDSETEKYIQGQIDLLKGSVTILIIAHRLSTVKNADKIVILEKGTINQVDSFVRLKETSEKFRRMLELQQF